MAHAARTGDPLLPQPTGGLGQGAVLAVLAHAGLLAALTLAVQWRSGAPDTVSAELWSAVPQVAAPPAPPPAPPPPPPAPAPAPAPAPPAPAPAPPPPKPAEPDAQIAIEQAKKAKAEQERQQRLREEREQAARERAERERVQKARLEQERQQREAEARRREQQQRELAAREKERQQAEERRLAELRQQQLDRMMGQVGGSTGGTAAVSSGPSASYAGRLIAAIKPNVVFTDSISGNPAAEVEVRAGPGGSILSRRLVRSSGNKDWDEAVLRAIDRTGTLPRDVDGRVPAVILMAFRPNELN